MAIIAGTSHNITIGCLFGSFSVLMMSVEQRLGVSRELSSLGVPLVAICNGILAPFVGAFAARYSLRLLLLAGIILSILGYAVLASTQSYPLYLAAYGLLLGPGLCLAGSVLPATLVTRWFTAGRGKALGLVHMPIVVAIVPIVSSILLRHLGAPLTYGMLGAFTAFILLPLALLVVDYPTHRATGNASSEAAASPSATAAQIASSSRFWAFALAAAVTMAGSVVVGTHLVPMAEHWGMSATAGATLLTISSLAGIPGSVAWGWVADRIGGGPALALAAVNCAALWAILLTEPSYPVAIVVMGLLGLHGTSSIPVLSMALSETFGQANFSRAYGLSNLMTLPFTVIGIQGASAAYVKTGSYVLVSVAMIALFLVIAPLPYLARNKRVSVPST